MNYTNKRENFQENNMKNLNNKIRHLASSQEKDRKEEEKEASYFETDYSNSDYIKNSESLEDMFKALSNSEHLCDELDKHQKNKDLIEQANINERTLNEIADQEKRIEELKRIVDYLRTEKTKRERISTRCKAKTKDIINKDYETVTKLAKKGLLQDEGVKLDVNVSDSLKTLIDENKRRNNSGKSSNSTKDTIRANVKRCPYMDTKKYIDAEKLRGKCVGCNVDSLKDNLFGPIMVSILFKGIS